MTYVYCYLKRSVSSPLRKEGLEAYDRNINTLQNIYYRRVMGNSCPVRDRISVEKGINRDGSSAVRYSVLLYGKVFFPKN